MAGTNNGGQKGGRLPALQPFGPMLLAIVLVLGVVAGLFEHHRRTRLQELEELYARSVAHVGRHAELKLQSFAAVINNLRPDVQKQTLDAQALVRALAAKNRLESTSKAWQTTLLRSDELNAQAVALQQRTAAIENLVAYHRKQAAQTTAAVTAQRQRVNDAIQAVHAAQKLETTAWDAQKLAAQLAKKQTERAHKAAQAAEKAVTELQALEALTLLKVQHEEDKQASKEAFSAIAEQAQAAGTEATAAKAEAAATQTKETVAEGSEKRPDPGQKPPVEPAPAGDEDANAKQAAKGPLPEARANANKAQQAAVAAARVAADANAAADKRLREAELASQRVAALGQEVVGALNDYVARLKTAEGAATGFEEVSSEYARRRQALEDANEQLKESNADVEELRESLGTSLSRAAEASAAASALQSRVMAGALPSYDDELRQCLRSSSVVEDEGTCLMQATARMKGLDPQLFRFVPCPASVQEGNTAKVWLSEDRRQLLYPLDQTLAGTSGCVQISVGELMAQAKERMSLGHSGRALLDLDEVILVGPGGFVLDASTTSPIRIDRLPNFDPKAPSASRMLHDVELGATKYRTFLQPVTGHIAVACHDKDECPGTHTADRASGLMVVGLVKEQRLLLDSMRLRPASFLYVGIVLALLLIGLPLTKLFLVHPSSRYTWFDGAFLGAGAGVATLLVTVTIWSLFAHERLERRVDDELTEANDVLTQAIETELSSQAALLARMTSDARDLTTALAAQQTDGGMSRAELTQLCQHVPNENSFAQGG